MSGEADMVLRRKLSRRSVAFGHWFAHQPLATLSALPGSNGCISLCRAVPKPLGQGRIFYKSARQDLNLQNFLVPNEVPYQVWPRAVVMQSDWQESNLRYAASQMQCHTIRRQPGAGDGT